MPIAARRVVLLRKMDGALKRNFSSKGQAFASRNLKEYIRIAKGLRLSIAVPVSHGTAK
jgi:hypothetical protein